MFWCSESNVLRIEALPEVWFDYNKAFSTVTEFYGGSANIASSDSFVGTELVEGDTVSLAPELVALILDMSPHFTSTSSGHQSSVHLPLVPWCSHLLPQAIQFAASSLTCKVSFLSFYTH